jgi:hypothetical protein
MKAERQGVGLQAAMPVSGRFATADMLPQTNELSDVLSEFAHTMVTNFPIQKIQIIASSASSTACPSRLPG